MNRRFSAAPSVAVAMTTGQPDGAVSEPSIRSDWYRHFEFARGVMRFNQLPRDGGNEVVFAGRSNVGKSSVINALTDRRALARISKTPGRTRQLNYFINGSGQRLVDLPGYGYARVSEELRQKWRRLLHDYFSLHKSIRGGLLIMDVRHPLTVLDEQMLACMDANHVPAHILLNKADKLSRGPALRVQQQLVRQIGRRDVSIQLFSARKRQGLAELRQVVARWLFSG